MTKEKLARLVTDAMDTTGFRGFIVYDIVDHDFDRTGSYRYNIFGDDSLIREKMIGGKGNDKG